MQDYPLGYWVRTRRAFYADGQLGSHYHQTAGSKRSLAGAGTHSPINGNGIRGTAFRSHLVKVLQGSNGVGLKANTSWATGSAISAPFTRGASSDPNRYPASKRCLSGHGLPPRVHGRDQMQLIEWFQLGLPGFSAIPAAKEARIAGVTIPANWGRGWRNMDGSSGDNPNPQDSTPTGWGLSRPQQTVAMCLERL